MPLFSTTDILSTCFTSAPFPIPFGLVERPAISILPDDSEVEFASVAYSVEKIDNEGEVTELFNSTIPACCDPSGLAVRWPTTNRLGGLYLIDPVQYLFTGIIQYSDDMKVECSPALLNVISAECLPRECDPCGLEVTCSGEEGVVYELVVLYDSGGLWGMVPFSPTHNTYSEEAGGGSPYVGTYTAHIGITKRVNDQYVDVEGVAATNYEVEVPPLADDNIRELTGIIDYEMDADSPFATKLDVVFVGATTIPAVSVVHIMTFVVTETGVVVPGDPNTGDQEGATLLCNFRLVSTNPLAEFGLLEATIINYVPDF